MENDIERQKPSVIFTSSIKSETKDITDRSAITEAAREDNLERSLVKELIKELSLDNCINENVDPLIHNPSCTEDQCAHCKIMKKVGGLQTEISKMNSEIGCTHEILNLKKMQNNELRNTIKRLESTLAKNDGIIIEKKESCCLCSSDCTVC